MTRQPNAQITALAISILFGIALLFFPIIALGALLGTVLGLLLIKATPVIQLHFTGIFTALSVVLVGVYVITLGQFGRIPPLTGEILLIDIIALIAVGFLVIEKIASKEKLRHETRFIILAGIGLSLLTGLITTGLATSTRELIIASLYALRFFSYLSLAYLLSKKLQDTHGETLLTALRATGVVVSILAFVQLAFLPNLAVLTRFGWDPHIGRAVSTFLDPNYLAGFLSIILAIYVGHAKAQHTKIPWFIVVIIMLVGILTFSRSGYLALGITVIIATSLYSWKVLLISVLASIPIALSIPRVNERIMGALSFDTTSQMRVRSWNQALSVAEKLPITGTGYNLYRRGLIESGAVLERDRSHASSGSDSSFLGTYATMGIVGLGLLLALILTSYARLRMVAKQASGSQKTAAYALLICLPALFVHSWFVNSFYYSLIVFPLTILFAIAFRKPKLQDEHVPAN